MPKRAHDPNWSQEDIARLKQGLADLASGKELLPSSTMQLTYYLQHYVMERKFSEGACRAQLKKLHRTLPGLGGDVAKRPQAQDDSGSESDSADELELPLAG